MRYYLRTLDGMRIGWEGGIHKSFDDANSFKDPIDAYNFYKEVHDSKEDEDWEHIELVSIFTFKGR